MGFLSCVELAKLGFKSCGRDVKVSEWAKIYNPGSISLGDNVRIDDFCILSAGLGEINLGSHIHIGAYSSIVGKGNITLKDYCNISMRVSIFSSNDDYSGQYMTSPVIDTRFTNVDDAPIHIERHCIVGCGSVVLPGSKLGIGVAIGAMSLVRGELKSMCIYAGTPFRIIRQRENTFLHLEGIHRDYYMNKIFDNK